MKTHRGEDCVCFEEQMKEFNDGDCPCGECCGGSPCHQEQECQHCIEKGTA